MGPYVSNYSKNNMNSTIFLFLWSMIKTNNKRTLNILTIFKDEEHNNCSFPTEN